MSLDFLLGFFVASIIHAFIGGVLLIRAYIKWDKEL